MDANFRNGLASLAPYAVAVVVLRADGDRLVVLQEQPEWMALQMTFTLPEVTMAPGETIEGCAERAVSELTSFDRPRAVGLETRVRGPAPLVGVVSCCTVCVSRGTELRSDPARRLFWGSIASQSFIAGYGNTIAGAVREIAYRPEDVATLIASPDFTMSELCDAMNRIRQLAGVKGKMDIRNLRRDLIGANWLKDTGRTSSAAHRPAKLFTVL